MLLSYVIGVDGVVGLHYSDVCDTYGFRDSIVHVSNCCHDSTRKCLAFQSREEQSSGKEMNFQFLPKYMRCFQPPSLTFIIHTPDTQTFKQNASKPKPHYPP